MLNKILAFVFGVIVLNAHSHASGPLAYEDETIVNFKSELVRSETNNGVWRLKGVDLAKIKKGTFSSKSDQIRIQDELMMVALKGTIMAAGSMVLTLPSSYDAFSKDQLDSIMSTERTNFNGSISLNSGVRWLYIPQNINMDITKYVMDNSLVEARGKVKLLTTFFEAKDAYVWTLGCLVIKPQIKESPIRKITLFPANNQFPMRLRGCFVFAKNPIVEIETVNVSIIDIIYDYTIVDDDLYSY
jgi:hypothetical protein